MLKRYGEGLSRETLSALTAVCFFRRTEILCRIAPKRNIDAVCPAILLTTQGTFLNLNRYREGLSREPHSMLKRYGGEQNRKPHSMLKRYGEGLSRETLSALTAVCFFRRTENLCRIAPKRNIDAVCPAILLTTQGTFF